MLKKNILAFVAMSAVTFSIMAVPAKRTPIEFVQPDGSVVTIMKRGDERCHITTNIDGRVLTTDDKGFYYFANIDAEGNLAPTPVKAAALSALSESDRKLVESIDNDALIRSVVERIDDTKYAESTLAHAAAKVDSRANKGGIGLMDNSFLGFNKLKGLVILAQYPDKKFSMKDPQEFFSRMLNEEGFSDYSGTGSARDYFIDSSNGQFVPEFDVYGPVTLPNNMAYYGANDSGRNDKRPAQMIYDACAGLDDEIDFSQYDQNKDGYVENVFVFYAGYGEASGGGANTIWPHQWSLSAGGLTLRLDGVRVNKYACSNELEYSSTGKSIPDGIGTFVHEFSHVLGLPDLYCTNTSLDGDWTPQSWNVLDYGPYNNNSRTPPAYSTFERYALGWIDPQVLSEPGNITLEALNTSNQACIIPTASQNEFFLLENRQQTGWDTYLPGSGMLIWHIDFVSSKWTSNIVNNTESHSYVDIEEACGYTVSSSDFNRMSDYLKALAAYAFPGSSRNTSFTDDTTPSMKTWKGVKLGLPITNITEIDGLITFKVAGGIPLISAPEALEAEEVGENRFIAKWSPVEGAQSYLLTVKTVSGEGEDLVETADFGSGSTFSLPEGWTLNEGTKVATYTTSGNYGATRPSMKLAETGNGFSTPKYENDIIAISFWAKGKGTDGGCYLTLEGLVEDKWVDITRVILAEKAETIQVNDVPAGVKSVRLTYTKGSTGNVAIDDFTITITNREIKIFDKFEDFNVGKETSYAITNIPEGIEFCRYKVRAVDANGEASKYSNEIEVKLETTTGIEDITVDGDAALTVVGNVVMYNGKADTVLTVTDLAGRVVAQVKADAEGVAAVKLGAAGIYIAKAGNETAKIAVE